VVDGPHLPVKNTSHNLLRRCSVPQDRRLWILRAHKKPNPKPFFKVLGSGSELCERTDVEFIPSGNLDESEMDLLFRCSEFIVLPSFAEGFGYPLLEALSYGKNIYLRDIPCYREILGDLGPEDGIFFLDDFSKVVEPLKASQEKNLNNFDENYSDYIHKIIDQANNNLSIKTYTELCAKIKYIDLANMEVNKNCSLGKTLYIVLAAIYGGLYRFKFARPLLMCIKSIMKKVKLSKLHLLS
jgi:hypothetical protein